MTVPVNPPTADDFRAAAAELLGWRRPLLLTHERPDGDALGCMIALHSLLRARGVESTAALFEPVPRRYAFLEGVDDLQVVDLQVVPAADDSWLARADGVVVMDTCSFSQLTPVADWLRGTSVPIIALDHHRTRDLPARRLLVDENAAAASLLVYHWARAADWELSDAARIALFVGIATDTGWFRYSNTSAECLRVAAELVEQGVDLDALQQQLYLADPVSMLRARAVAMSRLELHLGDTVALLPISQAMLREAQAAPADLDDSVNLPMSTATVELSVLLVETEGGLVKCSFRSKGGIDVAQLAASFGGGGHARAAGARIPGTLADARSTILAAIDAQAKS